MDLKKWAKIRKLTNVSGFIVVAFVMINLLDKNGRYIHDFSPNERFLLWFLLFYAVIVAIVNAIHLVHLKLGDTRINGKTVIWGIIVAVILLLLGRLKELY
jgi:hypothetical protein